MRIGNERYPLTLFCILNHFDQGQSERHLAGCFMALEAEPGFLWANKQFREIRQKGCAVKIDMLA